MDREADGTSSTRTLIFALGSAHGDDQIGWLVAERLAMAIANSDVIIRASGSAGELLHLLEGTDRLIVCDACQSGDTPGAIHCWRWPNAPLENLRNSGSHDLSLASTLALGQQLGLLPRDVIIFGIEGNVFLPGAPLQAPLEEAVDRVAEAITTRASSPDRT